MSHSFAINFEPRPERERQTRRLDVVITPVDDFTGRIIVGGVAAEIPRQRVRAGQSLSGHLVFERLIPEARHVVHVDPEAAGYFHYGTVEIDMPQDRDTRIVRLIQRPDAVVDGSSMIVRGSVVQQGSGDPVADLAVTGRVAGVARQFTTRTNGRGNFALCLQPPRPPSMDTTEAVAVPLKADVTLIFAGAGIPDIVLNDVEDMCTRVLDAEVVIP